MDAKIDYTNHRGERAIRRVRPVRWYCGSSVYHPEVGWLLEAWDFDREAYRTFALKDIHSWLNIIPTVGVAS